MGVLPFENGRPIWIDWDEDHFAISAIFLYGAVLRLSNLCQFKGQNWFGLFKEKIDKVGNTGYALCEERWKGKLFFGMSPITIAWWW